MKFFDQIIASLREKSGKKLVGFTIAVFLIITIIVFGAAFELCRNIELKAMDQILKNIPNVAERTRMELQMRGRVYEDDVLTRAELGLKLYEEENELAQAQKLERVRSMISADAIFALDEQRQILASAGTGADEPLRACIRELEPHVPHLELYAARPDDGMGTDRQVGTAFVLIPLPENIKHSLVFAFSSQKMLELYNDYQNWPSVFEHILPGQEALAFAKTGDMLAGYPMDKLTAEQSAQLHEEVTKLFENSDSFRSRGGKCPSKVVTLLGEKCLAALQNYSELDTDILMAVPLNEVIRSGVYSAITISAFIGLGIVLLQIYTIRNLSRVKALGEGKQFRKLVRRAALPGLLVLLVVTVLFAAMLLMLESRTNSSYLAMSNLEDIQREINWQDKQKGFIRSTFAELYRTRAQALADFLEDHPEAMTREGLQEMNSIAGTDYLMCFDRSGRERVSSNSYTGFSVGANLSEEYQAVLLGYPYAVVGPAADPYTGRVQLGTAILMTDRQGNPDGFLLAVYSAEELNAELERMSYESTVNSFAVQPGHIVAAISDENGCFIAHSDPGMIGQRAENYVDDYEPGRSFEGFTDYNGKSVYLSARSADGKTLLYMVPEGWDAHAKHVTLLMAAIIVLILALVYYPVAIELSAKAVLEAKDKVQVPVRPGSAIKVFSDGYVIFLTILAIFALLASVRGWWSSFAYVFSGQWSKGVHLFSIWAALFITAVTLCLVFVIRLILHYAESRLSLRAKTITRLADSLVSYVAGIFLTFCVLDMFGVNTTALLASAGIVTIAVGMGAQSMASDLLAGFFMMLEGSIHVGDHVSAGGVTGYVTDMGIRTTEITDENGNVVILSNSRVGNILNMSRKEAEATDEISLT